MNVSVGEVRTETGDVQLRAQNLADTQSDFERIVIRQTPGGGARHGRCRDRWLRARSILAALDGRSA